MERAREMAKIFENAVISEPEKVHRSPAGYCTISSRPNCRRGTNLGKIRRNASTIRSKKPRPPRSNVRIMAGRF